VPGACTPAGAAGRSRVLDHLLVIGFVHRAETKIAPPASGCAGGAMWIAPSEPGVWRTLCRQPGPPALFLLRSAPQTGRFRPTHARRVHQPERGVRTHFAPRGCRAPLRRGGGRGARAGGSVLELGEAGSLHRAIPSAGWPGVLSGQGA